MQCLGLAKPPEENAGDKYKVDGVPEQENMGGAAAAAGGGGMMGKMMSGMLANPELMSMFSSGQAPPAPDPAGSRSVFGSKAAMVAPADVIMFSGCQDDQTSADVHNVTPLLAQPLPGDGVSWPVVTVPRSARRWRPSGCRRTRGRAARAARAPTP